MEFLKSIAGKVVAGLVVLAVVAAGISWWQMDATMRADLLRGTGRIAAWLGVVVALPWATFFLTTWTARKHSNFAGVGLILAYTAVEVGLLLWLFGWTITGATAWTFMIAGTLLAAVYNLLTCDWLAEKLT